MSKIILTNEVNGLGSAGDVVEVKAGFARNYLIPKGFAVAWSRNGEKQVQQLRAARDAKLHASEAEVLAIKSALEANPLRIEMKAGKAGRLFGAVKHSHVADAVSATGIGAIDKRKVEFAAPIRTTGEHEATVRVGEYLVNLKLLVVAAK
jgi:large subunit ribosomal protein L9